MKQRRRFFAWRICLNCDDLSPVAGCLCWRCIRAALVPVLLVELVRLVL